MVKDYKSKIFCDNCGMSDHRCIDFHHIENNKTHNVAQMAWDGYAFERIMKEISKCVPLCANCHRIEHYNSG